MPFALSRSKEQAQGIQCVSNLKQLSLGWAIYGNDNRGYMMPNGDEAYQPTTQNPTADPQWCPGREDLAGDSTNVYIMAGAALPLRQDGRHL